MSATKLTRLLNKIRKCTICEPDLPHGARPVLRASHESKVLIVGQAPGRRVHESGVPWDDPSGDRLREWLDVDRDQFYDPERFAIVPMGFCYPGTGKSGDLPPRPECAPEWHESVLDLLPNIELTLLLSRYAHVHYLGSGVRKTVTETVRAWREFMPDFLPLPHPSPRNNRWLSKNAWFEEEVVPCLRDAVARLISS